MTPYSPIEAKISASNPNTVSQPRQQTILIEVARDLLFERLQADDGKVGIDARHGATELRIDVRLPALKAIDNGVCVS